ncbi:MAG: hypothetical protein IPG23_24790, partial [Burkholderiales bacterium]|nr:hypothetical protein [Burkholderiales bacterium]
MFSDVTLTPSPGASVSVDLSAALPPVTTPWGNVVLPNLTGADYIQTTPTTGRLRFTVETTDPGQFAGKIIVRALFDDGRTQDIQPQASGIAGTLDVIVPQNITIGTVGWQLVRLISTDQINGQGGITQGEPIEFAGNVMRLSPKPDLMATLTRTGISFFREDREIASTNLTYASDGGL